MTSKVIKVSILDNRPYHTTSVQDGHIEYVQDRHIE